ncbi:hypothetical protein ACQP3C_28165, partial [Escherichia coli]
QLKGERDYFSSQFMVQAITTGNSRQQEPEAAGHTVSTVKKQRMNEVLGLLPPFYAGQDRRWGMVLTTFRVVFLPQLG